MAGKDQKRREERGGGTHVRHSCRDCIIKKVSFKVGNQNKEIRFRTRRQVGGYRVSESTTSIKITAEPSISDCTCTWDDKINVEFIRIHTGLANQTRNQLFKMPQLVETRRARISKQPNFITINECTLTMKIKSINQALRNGNVKGAQFNLKAVPTRIGVRVRCNGKWRTLLIVITD